MASTREIVSKVLTASNVPGDVQVIELYLPNGAVTTEKLATGAVTADKLDPSVLATLTADMTKAVYDTDDDGVVDQAEVAVKLQTPRNITLTGDVTGAATFDGSANVTIATTVEGGGGGTPITSTLDLKVDFGAVGDGVADDTTKITLAIIAAATQKKELRIPNGTYRITSRVVVDDLTGVRIHGEPGATIQCPPNVTPRFHMITFRNCHDIVIDGLTIDGNYSAIDISAFANHGVLFQFATTNWTVKNCTFKNFTDTCIYDATQGSFSADYNPPIGNTKDSQALITQNRFFDCNHCFNNQGGGSRFGIVSHNHYVRCNTAVKLDGQMAGGVATYSKKSSGWIIANNVCHDMGVGNVAGPTGEGTGIAVFCLEEGYENITIESNEVYGYTSVDGIKISGGQTIRTMNNVRIAGNRFANSVNAYAVRMVGVSDGVEFGNITIERNDFLNSTRGYFFISNSGLSKVSNILIQDNKFFDWSSGNVNPVETGGNSAAINVVLTGAVNANTVIKGNQFIRINPTYRAAAVALRVQTNTLPSKQDLIVEGNVFVNLNAADTVVNILTTSLTTLVKAIFRNNSILKGKAQFSGVDADIIDNWIEGTVFVSFAATGGLPSTANVEYNRLKQGVDTYLLRIAEGTITSKNNRFDPAVLSPVLVAPNGAFNEPSSTFLANLNDVDASGQGNGKTLMWNATDGNHEYVDLSKVVITSDTNGIPYKLSVSDGGVLTAQAGVVGFDNFNRADSNTTMGNALIGGAWTVHQGTWGIRSNAAYAVTDVNRDSASIDIGTFRYIASMIASGHVSGNFRYPVFLLHFKDMNNFLYARTLATEVGIVKMDAGSATVLSPLGPSSTVSGTPFKFEVRAGDSSGGKLGGKFDIYVDDIFRLSYELTDPDRLKYLPDTAQVGGTGSTRVGLQLIKGGTPTFEMNVDEFKVEPL